MNYIHAELKKYIKWFRGKGKKYPMPGLMHDHVAETLEAVCVLQKELPNIADIISIGFIVASARDYIADRSDSNLKLLSAIVDSSDSAIKRYIKFANKSGKILNGNGK